jgi:hypothetical protein
VGASNHGGPGAKPGYGHVGFVMDKVGPPCASVISANSHFTDCSTFIITCRPGLVQWVK